MADWLSVILLIVGAVILIIIELIFIPGTTVFGILGFLMLLAGIYVSFAKFGQETGLWVLAGTTVFTISALVYSLRSGTWKRFALKEAIDSKVNQGETEELQVGLRGVALSDLRPIGSVEFQNKVYEAQTEGLYLESGSKVEVYKISDNKIIVKPIN